MTQFGVIREMADAGLAENEAVRLDRAHRPQRFPAAAAPSATALDAKSMKVIAASSSLNRSMIVNAANRALPIAALRAHRRGIWSSHACA